MHPVAAPWILSRLSILQIHASSSTEQLVSFLIASSRQGRAHDGTSPWHWTRVRPARAANNVVGLIVNVKRSVVKSAIHVKGWIQRNDRYESMKEWDGVAQKCPLDEVWMDLSLDVLCKMSGRKVEDLKRLQSSYLCVLLVNRWSNFFSFSKRMNTWSARVTICTGHDRHTIIETRKQRGNIYITRHVHSTGPWIEKQTQTKQ